MTRYRIPGIPSVELERRNAFIRGKQTTIAMEPMYWRMVELLAAGLKKASWHDLIVLLAEKQPTESKSLAAFVRVMVVKWMLKHASEDIHDKVFAVPIE